MKSYFGYFFYIIYSPFMNAYLFIRFLFGKNFYLKAHYQFLNDMKGDGFTNSELQSEGFSKDGPVWVKMVSGWRISVHSDEVSFVKLSSVLTLHPRNIDELRIIISAL